MKRNIIIIILIATTALLAAFKNEEKVLAEPEQLQGVYIFTDSKPAGKFKYLGTVKSNGAGGFASGQYSDVRDRLIKKMKSEYPEADGIMLLLNSGGTDRADAIKLE